MSSSAFRNLTRRFKRVALADILDLEQPTLEANAKISVALNSWPPVHIKCCDISRSRLG